MMSVTNRDSTPKQGMSGGILAWLVFAWLWVGIPLAWGVSQTVEQSLPLFRSAPAAEQKAATVTTADSAPAKASPDAPSH